MVITDIPQYSASIYVFLVALKWRTLHIHNYHFSIEWNVTLSDASCDVRLPFLFSLRGKIQKTTIRSCCSDAGRGALVPHKPTPHQPAGSLLRLSIDRSDLIVINNIDFDNLLNFVLFDVEIFIWTFYKSSAYIRNNFS